MIADLAAFVSFVADINICQEVDVGGLLGEPTNMANSEDPYLQAVSRAKSLLRNMEAITQSLYDDGMAFFGFAQSIPFEWPKTGMATDTLERQPLFTSLYTSARVLSSGSQITVEYLGKLLNVSMEQIASEDRFRESLAVRLSRMSLINGNNRLSQFLEPLPEANNDDEDVVDMDFAFRKGPARLHTAGLDGLSAAPPPVPEEDEPRQSSETTLEDVSMQMPGHKKSFSYPVPQPQEPEPAEDDDLIEKGGLSSKLTTLRNIYTDLGPTRATKIRQLLGEDAPERYIEIANADQKPWYLRSDHNKDEIVLNPDGGIRAGSMSALVERLTTHEYSGKQQYLDMRLK